MATPRVILCASRMLGQEAWYSLREHQIPVVAVVSPIAQEDIVMWWKNNTIETQAKRLGIPWISNTTREEERIKYLWTEQGATLLLSVQHPWILSADLLAHIDGQAINVHNAPLPDYSGNNGVVHAILNGEQDYAVTIHWIEQGIDEGPVIHGRHFSIARRNARELYKNTVYWGRRTIDQLCEMLTDDVALPRIPQEGKRRFYRKMIDEGLREITDIDDMERKARAFTFPPFEPAFFWLGGKKVHVVYSQGSVRIQEQEVHRETGQDATAVSR